MTVAASFLQGAIDTANLTTYTFGSQNLGVADSDRYIVAAIEARAGATLSVSSASIGGVAASIVAQTQNAGDCAALVIANVPSGTTGDVVVTFNTAAARASIQLYRLVGIDSETASHTATSAPAQDPTTTLDIPAGGVAIGCGTNFGGGSATWTGLTENYDAVVEGQILVSSAYDTFATAQTGRTITIDISGGSLAAGVFASWGEASAGSSVASLVSSKLVGPGVLFGGGLVQ